MEKPKIFLEDAKQKIKDAFPPEFMEKLAQETVDELWTATES